MQEYKICDIAVDKVLFLSMKPSFTHWKTNLIHSQAQVGVYQSLQRLTTILFYKRNGRYAWNESQLMLDVQARIFGVQHVQVWFPVWSDAWSYDFETHWQLICPRQCSTKTYQLQMRKKHPNSLSQEIVYCRSCRRWVWIDEGNSVFDCHWLPACTKKEVSLFSGRPGWDWWSGFLKRWPKLVSQILQHLTTRRAIFAKPTTISGFF